MGTGAVCQLPARRRLLAVDERGIGLRATWHFERGFVNLSLWSDDRCVETFHLAPLEAGRLIAFLASGLAEAVPEPVRRPPVAVPVPPESCRPDPAATRLGDLRRDVAEALDRAAAWLRP